MTKDEFKELINALFSILIFIGFVWIIVVQGTKFYKHNHEDASNSVKAWYDSL